MVSLKDTLRPFRTCCAALTQSLHPFNTTAIESV